MDIKRYDVSRRMSQIVAHGETIYLAGQVGRAGDSVEAQAREALARIETLLEQAGSAPDRLLQVTIWLSDMEHFDAMNAVWDAWVPEGAAPARACGEARLARRDLHVEIIAVAARRHDGMRG
jgi:enamine deaminase RidA (YjgF/YER057c/UK114 family)